MANTIKMPKDLNELYIGIDKALQTIDRYYPQGDKKSLLMHIFKIAGSYCVYQFERSRAISQVIRLHINAIKPSYFPFLKTIGINAIKSRDETIIEFPFSLFTGDFYHHALLASSKSQVKIRKSPPSLYLKKTLRTPLDSYFIMLERSKDTINSSLLPKEEKRVLMSVFEEVANWCIFIFTQGCELPDFLDVYCAGVDYRHSMLLEPFGIALIEHENSRNSVNTTIYGDILLGNATELEEMPNMGIIRRSYRKKGDLLVRFPLRLFKKDPSDLKKIVEALECVVGREEDVKPLSMMPKRVENRPPTVL